MFPVLLIGHVANPSSYVKAMDDIYHGESD